MLIKPFGVVFMSSDSPKKSYQTTEEIMLALKNKVHSDINRVQVAFNRLQDLEDFIEILQVNFLDEDYSKVRGLIKKTESELNELAQSYRKIQGIVLERGETYFCSVIHAFPFLNDVYESFLCLKRNSGVQFEKDYDCLSGKQIKTSKEAVRRIVNNFLENAFKHSGAKKIVLGADNLDDYFRIYVQDNGVGISEEFHGRIFEGMRLKNQTYEGCGLVHNMELAKILGAKIELNSGLGEGSTFSLYLQK